MANTPPLPKNLTKKALEQLIKACEDFYPVALMGEGYRGYAKNEVEVPELNQKWTDRSKFFDYITDLTGEKDIKNVYNILSYWYITPETFGPAATTPQKDSLEQLQKEAEERERQKTEIDAHAKEQTEQQIKTLQENALLKGKVVYLEPEKKVEVNLTSAEENARLELLKAARQSPRTFVEKFSAQMIEKLPKAIKEKVSAEEIQVIAKQVAADFLTRLVAEDQFTSIPATVFAGLLKSKLVPELLKNTTLPTLTALTAVTDGVTRSFLQPLVGEDLVIYYYQDPNITYKVTSEPTPNTTLKVDLQKLHADFGSFSQNPVFQALKDKAQDKLVDLGKKQLTSYIAKLPSDGLLGFIKQSVTSSSLESAFSLLGSAGTTYEATSTVGWIIQTGLPEWAPIIGDFAGKFGVDVGLAAVNTMTPVATTAVETTAITAAGSAAAAAETTAAVAGAAVTEGAALTVGAEIAGAVAGSALPFVGNIILPILIAVVSWVGNKIKETLPKIVRFIRKNAAVIGIIPLGIVLILPTTLLTPFLLAGASIFFVATVLVQGGGVAATATGGTWFVNAIFHSLIDATLAPWAKYIVSILLGLTVYTALALFIINSGAYITPPSGTFTNNLGQSEFITVLKVVDDSSIENYELPKTVTYTVTVSAPKGSLSNISFKNDCSVIKEGSPPSCTHPLPPETPQVIDGVTPFTFTYHQTYDSSFTDSLVTDNFTVTADSPDGSGTSVGSASVIIGKPPTACFDVTGNNWPANFKANVLSAVANLTTNYPKYSAKVCAGNRTLRIVYDPTKNPGGWGYYSGSTVYLNGGGLSSSIDTLYILAHESGHHVGFVSGPSYYVQYLDTQGIRQELPLCSYVNTSNPAEGFAEAVALYATHDASSQWTRLCSGTFQSKYPKHWNFENSTMF